MFYNHIDETWSFRLLDMSDYKPTKNKVYTYNLVVIDIFLKYTKSNPLNKKYDQLISDEFSKI